MDEEEFFERMLNRIVKDYGYDVASTLELLYMTKEREIKVLQQRIDKAVEYIEKLNEMTQYDFDNEYWIQNLFTILKGDDTND